MPEQIERMPDRAEDVHVAKDVIEVTDPGQVKDPGKETVSDTPPDSVTDSVTATATDKTTRDTTKTDAQAQDTHAKSGGGCTTGTGPSSGIYLILLLIFGLFATRKRRDS